MACPDDAELQAFLNEALTHHRVAVIAAHIDGCPHCQARLDRLTELKNSLMGRYNPSSAPEPAGSGSGTQAASHTEDTQLSGEPVSFQDDAVGLPRVAGFDVIAEVGRGRCSRVYKARLRQQNRLVALKILQPGDSDPAEAIAQWLAQAAIWSQIEHPQILRLIEKGVWSAPQGGARPYAALELLEGGSLRDQLRDKNRGSGPRWPSPLQAAALAEGLARAVHVAHCRGLVHGHLTAANILFPGLGQQSPSPAPAATDFPGRSSAHVTEPIPKITDFGMAHFAPTTAAADSWPYRAPEQTLPGTPVGPAVDVYALGAILFECLTGRPPPRPEERRTPPTPAAKRPQSGLAAVEPDSSPAATELRRLAIPTALAAITLKCLQPAPEHRYATAEALADDLRRFLDNRPVQALPASRHQRLWLWSRRHPIAAGFLAGLMILIAASVTLVLLAMAWL
ncbi:MAG: protein kinase [Gemmataceae bacterium]|nr:protein kinase [Gemmata sp.]MDW8197696.1 protein kinase [Gemmataceae bacterium]